MAAFCMGMNIPKSYCERRSFTASMTFLLPITKETLAPVRLKDFESENSSTPSSFAPSNSRKDNTNKDLIIDILVNNLTSIQINNIIRNIDNYINYSIDNKNLNSKYNIKNKNNNILYLKQKLELSLISKSNANQETNFKSTMNEKSDSEKDKKSKKEDKKV